MAGRPKKKGLDYFPFAVDFFDDEKIGAISGEFGIKGEITTVKLLCAIYRNGYFILWDEALKMKLLKCLPGISLELLERIVIRLVKWGFFEQDLFDTVKVLTSKAIQRRYFAAIKKRKVDCDYPYILISSDINSISDGRNSINDADNSQKKDNNKLLSPSFKNKEDEVVADVRASACEEGYADEVLHSPIWEEDMRRCYGLSTEELHSQCDQFMLDCRCYGYTHTDADDFRRHFNNWLRGKRDRILKQEKQRDNGNRQGNGAAATAEQRRDEAVRLAAEIFRRNYR